MRSGDVINMTENNKINPAFHLQFLILFLLLMLLTNHLVMLLCLFVINMIFFIYHKVYFFSFLKSCQKLMYCYFGLSVIIALVTLDIDLGIIVWVKLVLITKNIVYDLEHQDWMELLYAFDHLLWPLDYIGVSSSKVAWNITSFFRNTVMYLDSMKQYVKKTNPSIINFSWKSICGKIEDTKAILKMAIKSTKYKIKILDDMMRLRLFTSEKSRSNYHVAIWQPLDFIFLVILILLLASEVIR